MVTLRVLVMAFLVGGVVGALGFKRIGYLATIPLAVILMALSAVPVIDDLRRYRAEDDASALAPPK